MAGSKIAIQLISRGFVQNQDAAQRRSLEILGMS